MTEASAVIGILSFGIQVCQGITKYYGAWRDCPEEVLATSNTIDSLRTIFKQFKDILADKKLEKDTRTLVEERVSACLAGLRKLEGENKLFGSDKPSKFQMAVHRLAYPFKQDTLDRLKKVVGGLLGQFSIALQVLDIRAGSRNHEESSAAITDTQRAIEKVCTQVQVVRDLVNSVRAQDQTVLDHGNTNHAETIDHLEKLRLDGQQTSNHVRQLLGDAEAAKLERILTWIRAPDVTSNHNGASLRRHPGTGQWFLDLADYLSWKYSYTARLWVRGKIGCCKTVLASTIIEDMRTHCRAHPNCRLAYFYFTFSDDKKQSWEALLRSFVVQLSQGRSAVQYLASAFDHEYGTGLTVRGLEAALTEILTVLRCEGRNVFVVVDGLDESPDTLDDRVAVFDGLSRVTESFDDLHLLITSRSNADVQRFMQAWGASSVQVTAKFVNEDIKSFVRYQLASSPAFGRMEDRSRALVISKLGDNPDGMFRWAALHLEILRKLSIKTHARIEQALKILPPSLSATYEKMLSDIPDECATQVARGLFWLAVAPRPLTIDELAKSIYTNPDSLDIVVESEDVDPGDIVEIMSGLAEVIIQEKYCNLCLTSLDGKHYHCNLCFDNDFDLCEACRVEGKGCDHDSHILVSCDVRGVQLAHSSVEEYLLGGRTESDRTRRFLFDKDQARFASCRVIDLPDPLGRTALYQAVAFDDLERVELLLAQGANINAVAEYDSRGTPLHAAASRGNVRCVKLLLARGAEINAVNTYGRTALWCAVAPEWSFDAESIKPTSEFAQSRINRNCVEAEYNECVELLLQYGADPNIKFPLVHAAECGYVRVVKMLLDSGADVNLADDARTALGMAANAGHDEVAEILLTWGAGKNASHACGALRAAAICGHHLVVRTLLTHIADVADKDRDGQMALHFLAEYSDGAEAKRYEDHHGPRTSTAQLPLQDRYGLILDMLLAHDRTNINQPDDSGCTPLMLACRCGDLDFTERLLDHGPDLEARDQNGWTALFRATATEDCQEPVVDLLIARGARVNVVAWVHYNETGWTKESMLDTVLGFKHVRTVTLLTANGAKRMQDMDVDEMTCDVSCPARRPPKRRRSWPQYRYLPPLTRTAILPQPPWRENGVIRWNVQNPQWAGESVQWAGLTLSRSLSLEDRCM
ncbi:hypothetical protein LTR27_005686 [Elasticomyces elasticus]|nr:hypothetical protein LTR27_005686 [Elasticomyces elasticus]